ncbi:HAD family hydrolase [bacterium]|nr:HAD family hydrolase [bacterium]
MKDFFFFDLDGTLEDSRRDMVAAAQAVRANLHLPARSFAELVPFVNRGMRDLYLNCFDDYVCGQIQKIDEQRVSQVQALYDAEYGENIAVETSLYAGIREALTFAKQTGRTAVITNKPEALSKKLLAALEIDHLVDLVVGGDTCSEAKPSAVPLKHAFETLGGIQNQDRIYMIGDSQGDARAGALCGATTIWCAWGYQSHPPSDPSPQLIAATPQDLKTFFVRAKD